MVDDDNEDEDPWEGPEQEVCDYVAREFNVSIKRSALHWEPEDEAKPNGSGRYHVSKDSYREGETDENGRQNYVMVSGDSWMQPTRKEALEKLRENLVVDEQGAESEDPDE